MTAMHDGETARLNRGAQLTIRMLSGKILTVDVLGHDRVWDAKHEVSRQLGIPCDTQRLMLDTTELEDHRMLNEYDVFSGAELQLIVIAAPFSAKSFEPTQLLDELPESLQGHISPEDWERFVVEARHRKRCQERCEIPLCIFSGVPALIPMGICGIWLCMWWWLSYRVRDSIRDSALCALLMIFIGPISTCCFCYWVCRYVCHRLTRQFLTPDNICELATEHFHDAELMFTTAFEWKEDGLDREGWPTQKQHTYIVVRPKTRRRTTNTPAAVVIGNDAGAAA